MQHYRLLSNFSERLSVSDLPVSDPGTFNSTLIALHAILNDLVLDTLTCSADCTYQDLAEVCCASSQAVGVLIVDQAQKWVGMVSQYRLWQWRSQHERWQQVCDRPLMTVADWWHESLDCLVIDHQMPLRDVITLVLERSPNNTREPIVVQAPEQTGVVDIGRLFAAYIRLAQIEQAALSNSDIENLRRQHQLILNAIGEGVYGVDVNGNATFVNPAAAQMIGWDVPDLIGQSMHQVLHHSRADRSSYLREDCPIYAAFQDGIIHRVADEVFWRKDGTHFPVEYISTPMRDEQGQLIGAVVAFRDITQRKWAEAVLHRANEELEQMVQARTAELYQANEQLKELSDLRSRVVSMVCHEFRNPLNNILLSVSSLERYDQQLTLKQKEDYLLNIQDNVNRMTQMIDAILMIGKVEAKGIEVNAELFDVVSFCCELIAELERNESDRCIELSCRTKRLMATLDQQLLRSILTNILSNAMRYSPGKETIQFKLLKRKHHIVFQICDRGIGIASDDLPFLFEPFHRGRNVSNISGTGLGLSIVKRFVELHHGKIEVKSKLGAGTTFTVILPQHYAAYAES